MLTTSQRNNGRALVYFTDCGDVFMNWRWLSLGHCDCECEPTFKWGIFYGFLVNVFVPKKIVGFVYIS